MIDQIGSLKTIKDIAMKIVLNQVKPKDEPKVVFRKTHIIDKVAILLFLTIYFRLDVCMTKNLANNEPCRLPFIYDGITHYKCTSDYDYPTPWCAYKVNSTNHMLKWDDCASTCSVEGGKFCTFKIGYTHRNNNLYSTEITQYSI